MLSGVDGAVVQGNFLVGCTVYLPGRCGRHVFSHAGNVLGFQQDAMREIFNIKAVVVDRLRKEVGAEEFSDGGWWARLVFDAMGA